MAKQRAIAPNFTTGKVVFRFPKLSEVDYGSKDFPKPDGEYSLIAIMPADAPSTAALLKKLEPFYEQALQNGNTAFNALKAESRKKLGTMKSNPLFTELLDQDTEEPTGEIAFKFAMKASGEVKNGKNAGKVWNSRPPVFDNMGKPLIQGARFRYLNDDETPADIHGKRKPDIWGGTTGKVSFEVGLNKDGEPGYFIPGTGMAGLKLGLLAVQVLDLVSGGQRTADDYGFGDETGEGGEADTPFNDETTDSADF